MSAVSNTVATSHVWLSTTCNVASAPEELNCNLLNLDSFKFKWMVQLWAMENDKPGLWGLDGLGFESQLLLSPDC